MPVIDDAATAATSSALQWDAFVGAHPDGHHEQSSEYARHRQASGFICERVSIRLNAEISGGFQSMAIRTPLGRLAVIQRGPLADGDDACLLDSLALKIDDLAARCHLAIVRVDLFPTQCSAAGALIRRGFEPSSAWVGKRNSRLVDLSHSDAAILAQMRSKGRYNVRLAERNGIVVHEMDHSAIAMFYALHCESSQYHNCPVFSIEYFKYIWTTFVAAGRGAGFVAYCGMQPVAVILNTIVGGRMYYGWGGLDRRPEHARLMANYLLHFRAMQWAREYGCTHYDLCGDTEFKRKLGGEAIQWPLPLRKFYGPLAKVRKSMVEFCGTRPRLRRIVDRAAARIGYRPRMPY